MKMRTYSISAYCSRCHNHLHLTLTGSESEVLERRNTYVCSDCIVNAHEELVKLIKDLRDLTLAEGGARIHITLRVDQAIAKAEGK